MNKTDPLSISKNPEKYKALANSIGITNISSLTSKVRCSVNMIEDYDYLFKKINKNNLYGSRIGITQSMIRDYEAAIKPFKHKKYLWISQSQEIQKSIDSTLRSFGKLSQIASSASTIKVFGTDSMMYDNESFSKVFDRNRIFESRINSIRSTVKDYKIAFSPFHDNIPNLLSQSQEMQKSIDTVLRPLGGLSQLASLASTTKMLGLASMMKNNFGINQLKSIDLQSQLTNLISASNENFLEEMMISIQKEPIAVLNSDYIPSEIELATAVEILHEGTDQQSFIEWFDKLHVSLKAFLLLIIMYIVPITQDIASDLLKPIVREALGNIYRNDTDKIRIIQKSPSRITHIKIDTSHLRFITAKNGLYVRSNPSSKKSKIKDTIHLGKIVEVLEKRKNWIKISYKKRDKTIKGWVFTRYTKRFDP